jgi:glutaredoxin
MLPVILYTQPSCYSCTAAKQCLSTQNVGYEEPDVRTDPEFLQELLEDLGSSTTPTLVIGETVIVAFDREKIQSALRESSAQEES